VDEGEADQQGGHGEAEGRDEQRPGRRGGQDDREEGQDRRDLEGERDDEEQDGVAVLRRDALRRPRGGRFHAAILDIDRSGSTGGRPPFPRALHHAGDVAGGTPSLASRARRAREPP
jgi:hypothetical protein